MPAETTAGNVASNVTAVLIAKADELVLGGLRAEVLSVFPDCEAVVGRTGKAVLAALERRSFQILVFGLMVPDLAWLEDLPAILQHPRAGNRLAIAGGYDARTLRALHALGGISLFDPTTEGSRQLRSALETVAGGRRYVSAAIEHGLRRDVDVRPEEILSSTEERVLSVIGDGSDDAEAAARLTMNAATLATHRKNIMRKLGLHRVAELMRFALKHGYVARRLDGSLGPGITAMLKRAGSK